MHDSVVLVITPLSMSAGICIFLLLMSFMIFPYSHPGLDAEIQVLQITSGIVQSDGDRYKYMLIYILDHSQPFSTIYQPLINHYPLAFLQPMVTNPLAAPWQFGEVPGASPVVRPTNSSAPLKSRCTWGSLQSLAPLHWTHWLSIRNCSEIRQPAGYIYHLPPE